MSPWQSSASAAQSRTANRQRPLPSGFMSIRDVLDKTIPVNRFTSVIGLVKDRRTPIPTNGTDWKSSLTIYDKSTEEEGTGLVVSIFRPEPEIPIPDAGDVVVVVSAKVQFYRSEVSLLTNKATLIHVYSAEKIPRPPKTAKQALCPPLRPSDRAPGDREHEYVSWLYHSIDKDSVPDSAAFQYNVEQSRNVKDKSSILGDVQEGRFYDVIAYVVRDPFEEMDKTTLWVSDYTENENFYKFSWDATDTSEGRDGDEFGYVKTINKAVSNWSGPYGKRSMQVTCFEPHAQFVSSEVRTGQWIRLRNLQVKYGRNGNNLEGFLREDRSAFGGSALQVNILETDNPELADKQLKEAIRRKRDYEKAKKGQQKSLAAAKEDGNKTGTKRKAENAKQRRAEKRAAVFEKVKEQEEKIEANIGLNELVKCESLDQPVFLVPSIIEPVSWNTTVEGQEVTLILPFTCAKYRANVRVVDFRPRKLENFASWRKNTEYDLLSDYSGASDSESDSDGQGTLDRYVGPKTWEWRFALQLEEADPKGKGEPCKVWVVVNNTEGQQLLNLDASDLRADPDDLAAVREQLSKLWGNLEERKQEEDRQALKNQKRIANGQPPESSPPVLSNNQARAADEPALSNKPFTCCIRQYGVKVPESNPRRANAGDGKRWQRVFGLFGTRIR
ncbi:hypothetical protein F5B20DRAFT_558244 [Whalleya microplaca]|nr:hypothetical protein F5B20DRAFT_558244 [Whalleya microplaca]